jgi:hypothetical protein
MSQASDSAEVEKTSPLLFKVGAQPLRCPRKVKRSAIRLSVGKFAYQWIKMEILNGGPVICNDHVKCTEQLEAVVIHDGEETPTLLSGGAT